MGEEDYSDHLVSERDLSAFETHIRIAKSRAETLEIIRWFGLSEANFVHDFPDFAKKAQELPDGTP
ncbi:hypothetical protein [Streptomyces sp. NK08204]|uniref:hypothetical protein n=1 Tax=Streptomyces sp. NK08204 TaxID=2873260 RepID=UPI001CED45B4|nr:hypothetical protein [Streptomyces sp. NK08204]